MIHVVGKCQDIVRALVGRGVSKFRANLVLHGSSWFTRESEVAEPFLNTIKMRARSTGKVDNNLDLKYLSD